LEGLFEGLIFTFSIFPVDNFCHHNSALCQKTRQAPGSWWWKL